MNDTIADRIRRHRRQMRLTQVELAAEVGVSRNTVARWEMGVQMPAVALRRIATVFGVGIDAVLTGREESKS